MTDAEICWYNVHMSQKELIRKKYGDEGLFKSLVWDYKMSPQEFFDILDNKRALGNFNQDWAIGRVLENTNYYDAVNLVEPALIKQRWGNVKGRIFNKEIKHGYEYVLQRPTLSTTR